MAAAPKVTLVTIAVSGPGQVSGYKDNRWAWEVDGPGGMLDGHEGTEAEAWATARIAAVTVLGRLEAPMGGHTLADAIAGPTPPRCLP